MKSEFREFEGFRQGDKDPVVTFRRTPMSYRFR